MSQSPRSTTERAALSFKKGDSASQKFVPVSPKIGWIHTETSEPGAKYDIVVKDVRGFPIVEKRGCTSETNRFGELVNKDVIAGQEIDVTIENIEGAEEVNLFIQ